MFLQISECPVWSEIFCSNSVSDSPRWMTACQPEKLFISFDQNLKTLLSRYDFPQHTSEVHVLILLADYFHTLCLPELWLHGSKRVRVFVCLCFWEWKRVTVWPDFWGGRHYSCLFSCFPGPDGQGKFSHGVRAVTWAARLLLIICYQEVFTDLSGPIDHIVPHTATRWDSIPHRDISADHTLTFIRPFPEQI